MSLVFVAGFDTAAIHAARDAAGVGGTVFFPAGNYDVEGLTASVDKQTWKGERLTVLKRKATAPAGEVIGQSNGASLRLRGLTIDGNRTGNPTVGNGVYCPAGGCDLDIEDCVIQNVPWYGVATQDCELILNRVTIQNTKQDCVFWNNPSSVARRGPQIDKCFFDRSAENPASVAGGCVKIHGAGALDSRVLNSRFIIQYTDIDAAVLLEVKAGANLHVMGNTFTGGHTAISVGDGSAADTIIGNNCEYQRAYGVEYGGGRGLISGNNIFGLAGGTICGIIGNGCADAKAIGNNIKNCGVRVGTHAGGVLQDISNN